MSGIIFLPVNTSSESNRRLQILSITIEVIELTKQEIKYRNITVGKKYPVYVVGDDQFLIRDDEGTPWWIDFDNCKIIEQ